MDSVYKDTEELKKLFEAKPKPVFKAASREDLAARPKPADFKCPGCKKVLHTVDGQQVVSVDLYLEGNVATECGDDTPITDINNITCPYCSISLDDHITVDLQ